MRIILGCTRDTSCVAMRYLLDFPTMNQRIKIWRARAYLKICADKKHPLHQELFSERGERLLRGKSWLGRAEDIIKTVCSLTDITHGEEWIPVLTSFICTFSCIATLDRRCRQQNPVAVNAEVNAIISEYSDETDAIIYTDGSVICQQRSVWAFTAHSAGRTVKEVNGFFCSGSCWCQR